MGACMCVCELVCACMCMCVCVHACVHVHVCMCIHVHVHVCVCMVYECARACLHWVRWGVGSEWEASFLFPILCFPSSCPATSLLAEVADLPRQNGGKGMGIGEGQERSSRTGIYINVS